MDLNQIKALTAAVIHEFGWNTAVAEPLIAENTYEVAEEMLLATVSLEKHPDAEGYRMTGSFLLGGRNILASLFEPIYSDYTALMVKDRAFVFCKEAEALIKSTPEVQQLRDSQHTQKCERLQEIYLHLLTKAPPLQLISDCEKRGGATRTLSDFCIEHLRPTLKGSSGWGIVRVAKDLYSETIGEHTGHLPM